MPVCACPCGCACVGCWVGLGWVVCLRSRFAACCVFVGLLRSGSLAAGLSCACARVCVCVWVCVRVLVCVRARVRVRVCVCVCTHVHFTSTTVVCLATRRLCFHDSCASSNLSKSRELFTTVVLLATCRTVVLLATCPQARQLCF